MFNVAYDAPDGVRKYLARGTSLAAARVQCDRFRAKYVGQPYPNGRGFYPFTNPRVVPN